LPLSIVIAANNEEDYIAACLDAVLGQDDRAGMLDVIVAANACTDATEDIVAGYVPRFAARGWRLTCLHLPEPGKVKALNAGDAVAKGAIRAYLDADVVCDPALFGQLLAALDHDTPRYATGRLRVVRADSWITRQYARFWQRLPFVTGGAVGAGLFAVNAAGRALWDAFPDIISDDTFVRLQFRPDQRQEMPAAYHWPMIEGFSGLVRVRRRQDAGVREIHALYPDLIPNEAKASLRALDILRLGLRDPIGVAVYAAVHMAVRMKPHSDGWTRGR
jgi:glycosyltransferase involved in cell wall biosynthesis